MDMRPAEQLIRDELLQLVRLGVQRQALANATQRSNASISKWLRGTGGRLNIDDLPALIACLNTLRERIDQVVAVLKSSPTATTLQPAATDAAPVEGRAKTRRRQDGRRRKAG